MKIKVGGKYLMKRYPTKYLYVHILGKVSDILPDQGISFYNDKEKGVTEFYGVIVYPHGLVERITYDPNMGTWGENGEWDGAFFDDNNTIVAEYQPR